ncbi:MAG: hypothetical protein J6Y70_01540 [Bacilli bacterium]|nr:hypothetical protein [Bacilli bacterium]
MILKANAKINVTLNVFNKKNGFHFLETVILPIKLHDIITVKKVGRDFPLKQSVIFENLKIGINENICNKAVKYIEKQFKIKDKYLFYVKKQIPINSGLGGESSDVASIITFYIKKYKLKLKRAEKIKMALKFGCDVPFFIFNKPAYVSGIGDKLRMINVKKYNVLIIQPGKSKGLLTKNIFSNFDNSKKAKKKFNITKVIKALKLGNEQLLYNNVGNMLEAVATKEEPQIKKIKKFLINNNLIAFMTGAGNCVVSLFMSANNKNIKKIAKKLQKNIRCNVFITETQNKTIR